MQGKLNEENHPRQVNLKNNSFHLRHGIARIAVHSVFIHVVQAYLEE